MKRVAIILLLCCIPWLFTTACTKETSSKTTDTSSSKETIDTVSKTQILQTFYKDAAYQNCTVTDCVIAEDGAFGLTGVVLYTNDTGNPCCLAFVHDTWCYPLGLADDNTAAIAEDSVLTYLGNGTVTLSLVERKNTAIYDYIVTYTVDGPDAQFTVASEERS